tara:strand:+ start:3083 stop:5890 length:2808 start_codon:yes stop_codon:yes gene_type:complete
MKFRNITILLLTFLNAIFLNAQELPPVQNYSSEDYRAENQNWAISQDAEKRIYVANNKGLLEFNGAKWQLYPSPNNTVIRSVNVIDNRIYTGCYMQFGYWKINKFGSLEYSSLSDKLQEPLLEEEFWNILKVDNWILFQSLHRIYIFNTIDESFRIINSKTSLPKVFKVDESIYFQKMNDGIYRIENGTPVLISNHAILRTNIVVNIFSINKKILFQTQEKGFYYISEGKLTKWNIQADSILATTSVYSSKQLSDGSIILGTISKGIYHLDNTGNILHKINQETGLNNNTVLSIFEDEENNVWLGLDNGISVVNFNSPFSVYNDVNGKLGTVYTSAIFNENLYLGTNQGLFYKKIHSNANFKFIEGTKGQVWKLKEYDNTLFCGHNSGTFIVSEDSVNLISNVMGTWDIKPVINNKNILIQGNYNGLNVLEKRNNKWGFRNKIKGFDISSRYLELDSNNRIFVNHEYKGVFRIDVDSAFSKVLDYKTDISAPKGFKSGLVAYNNNLFYTSINGVYKYNNTLQKFTKESVFTENLLQNEGYISGNLISEPKTNTLWGFTDKHVVYFSPGKLNNKLKSTKIELSASLRRDLVSYESITHINDQKYLFGNSSGYIILDLDKLTNKNFEIRINSIQNSKLNSEKKLVPLIGAMEFKSKENNMFFTFSAPKFGAYTNVNYQYQLVGLYNEWSDWSPNSDASFKNLPFGDYNFKVNAQIGNIVSNNIASYSFSIKRPWYITREMIFVYFLLFIGLILVIHFFNKRYYKKQKIKIIEKKQRIFSLAQLENEKVIMKMKNEKLHNDIESKTRELAVSTMNIIKKNELLSVIKSELTNVKDESNVKPVIKIINKNLTNNDDWELFKEAFNNTDRDFLKKAKSTHPTLTPNDLRLCAYLRLNLSSKEIAPLLNISPRSVEIKRYRLRKKMDLSHENNLVEYILSI